MITRWIITRQPVPEKMRPDMVIGIQIGIQIGQSACFFSNELFEKA